MNQPDEAAAIVAITKNLNLNSGILIAVPVPAEFAMDGIEALPFFTILFVSIIFLCFLQKKLSARPFWMH